MLVAKMDGQRIVASEAEKGPEYRCPNCDDVVILKKGRIVAHHFAKIKEFRGIATRYDKTDKSYAANLNLVAAIINAR